MNKLVSKNPVLRFKLGKLIEKFQNGRFLLDYQDDGKWYSQEFDSEEAAKAFRLQAGVIGRITDRGTSWKNSVLKLDRSKDLNTSYARQQEEALYNGLSFKDAYAKAQKAGKRWFGYKGKVYDSGLKNPTIDNLTDMKAIYGNALGWSKDSKFNTKASINGRNTLNKQIQAKKARPVRPLDKSMTNKESSKKADELVAKTWNSAGFIDAISPQTAIGNFIQMGTSKLMGEDYTPQIYKAGYNIPGLAKDIVEGNYGDAAFRGLDTYLMFGAPGVSKVLDYAGTRFAPRLTNLSSKSAYLSLKATIPVVDGSGNVVGRTLNPMAEQAIRRGSGATTVLGEGTRQFGQRSMQRALNEGVLRPFTINGGMNNASRWGNAAIQNKNTGLTYIFRNTDGTGNLVKNSYDNIIDNAVNGISPLMLISEPFVQQAYNIEK